jgi:acetate---CoA ligase (ADP-forming)
VARVRETGVLLLGPNCLGVADARADLRLASAGFRDGPVGLISQIGNPALEIGELLAAYDLGISRFALLGDQADRGSSSAFPTGGPRARGAVG